ncbi:hypothetical protein DL766_000888 [Monosporascus sp. MC13-8B]|uniref:Uncharacterized protein n=1 Tax=Monosporascus cannonballus TaxID=155416 RepID=A0ABY0H5W9_9PEZI|nr:hypothetical protein DL762_005083 [Monosporascus cannonballus]RYO93925.1 hypothetical protein DL763_004252 [Monosporascus cannonballus]RYP38678.1 hypothetical protein DL766_000888 [Monosporascus sp. MC13-8B]
MVDLTNTSLPSHNRSAYQQYPYLTGDEFAEACHLLDSRYYRATLGPLRKQWRLTVHTALDVSFAADSGLVTFLQITRPLEDDNPTDNELASQIGAFSLDGNSQGDAEDTLTEADEMMVETEDLDEVSEGHILPPLLRVGIIAHGQLVGSSPKAIASTKVP